MKEILHTFQRLKRKHSDMSLPTSLLLTLFSMRTHILSYLFGILTAVLILVLIQSRSDVPAPPTDDIAAILANVPNQSESDHRKRTTLIDACLSIAELIQSGAIADTDEVADAYRIETANLRISKDWHSIQERIETLLRNAETVEDQEVIIMSAIVRLQR